MKIDSRNYLRWINLQLKFRAIRGAGETYIARRSVLSMDTTIGRGTRINGPTFVRGVGKLRIGHFCACGHEIRFITSNHSVGTVSLQHRLQRSLHIKAAHADRQGIVVGHGAWIGDRAIIMPGVNIGNGAVVGAGSIVTRDVAAYAIHAGNPARHIRNRFDSEIAAAVDQLAWWEWSSGQMQRTKDLFAADLSQMNHADALRLIETAREAVSQ